MKKFIACVLLVLIAQTGFAENSGSKSGIKYGLMFDLSSLLGDLTAYGDGFQSGAGFKFFPLEPLGIRCLLNYYTASNSTTHTSQTSFGMGLGGEYHFVTGPASPYAGLSLGITTYSSTTGGTTTSDPTTFYMELFGGGEVKLLDYISAYFEYNLLAVFGETFTLRMGQNSGVGKNAVLGLIIYF